jgi:CRISPR-associated protein Cas2
MLWVICYDISDDRRRNRVAKALLGYGERVQESVFECHLDPARLRQLQAQLKPLVHELEDRLRYYPLCGKDVPLVVWRGLGRAPREQIDVII